MLCKNSSQEYYTEIKMQGQGSEWENSVALARIASRSPANNLPYEAVAELLKYYK